jgi:ParB family chromosome partitioning protein
MNRIATGIPIELIHAIGPAHGVGRRTWEKLFKLCETDCQRAQAIAKEIPRPLPGPDRLEAAIALLAAPRLSPTEPTSPERIRIGRKGNRITLDVDPALVSHVEDAIRRLIPGLLDRGQGEAPGDTNDNNRS